MSDLTFHFWPYSIEKWGANFCMHFLAQNAPKKARGKRVAQTACVKFALLSTRATFSALLCTKFRTKV